MTYWSWFRIYVCKVEQERCISCRGWLICWHCHRVCFGSTITTSQVGADLYTVQSNLSTTTCPRMDYRLRLSHHITWCTMVYSVIILIKTLIGYQIQRKSSKARFIKEQRKRFLCLNYTWSLLTKKPTCTCQLRQFEIEEGPRMSLPRS